MGLLPPQAPLTAAAPTWLRPAGGAPSRWPPVTA